MNETEPLLEEIYYVESDDDTVLIAMDVKIDNKNSVIEWFDTNKTRTMYFSHYETTKDGSSSFVRKFVDEDSKEGVSYRFTPLTLEIYNEKVKSKLPSRREFNNLSDLRNAFIETKTLGY